MEDAQRLFNREAKACFPPQENKERSRQGSFFASQKEPQELKAPGCAVLKCKMANEHAAHCDCP